MTREESLKILRDTHDKALFSVRNALETLIPELTESEDGRIRKGLIEALKTSKTVGELKFILPEPTREEGIAYLEKQKELDKMIVVSPEVWDKAIADAYENGKKDGEKQKENPKSADSIPSDCMSDAKCEDRDSKYGVFPEDVIVVARACEKLETHGYPELAHALKNVNLYTKEQKPVDYEAELKKCKDNPLYFYDKYVTVKLKSAKWSEEDEQWLESIIKDYEDNLTKDKDHAAVIKIKIDFLKSLCPQPHSEWRHYIWATNLRFDFTALIKYDNTDNYEIVQAGNRPKQEKNGVYILIKDIKPQPSWKPSEEQMRYLLAVINEPNNAGSESCHLVLKELYEQLKTL